MCIDARVGIPDAASVRGFGLCGTGGGTMRLAARLARLEAKVERPAVVFKVVWDDDDDQEATPGRRIRLHWDNDHEQSSETP